MADHIRFAELVAATNFSFLRGASHPSDMVGEAIALGMRGIGIADRNTLAGVVRMHSACTGAGLRPLIGCRLDLSPLPLAGGGKGVGALCDTSHAVPTPSALRASSPPASGRGVRLRRRLPWPLDAGNAALEIRL